MEYKTQNLLEQIEAYLKSKGFEQEQNMESPVFKLQRDFKQPGSVLVVNGQRIQMPDQEFIHTVTVEFFGPGIVDEGTEQEDRFEIIRFRVEDMGDGGKSVQEGEGMEGFYLEDLDRFKQMISKLI